jgi:hypothetical protein
MASGSIRRRRVRGLRRSSPGWTLLPTISRTPVSPARLGFVPVRADTRRNPQYAELFYNLACCESLAGRKTDAIEHLRQAIGLSEERFRAYAKEDSDFDPIRDEPAFKELFGAEQPAKR